MSDKPMDDRSPGEISAAAEAAKARRLQKTLPVKPSDPELEKKTAAVYGKLAEFYMKLETCGMESPEFVSVANVPPESVVNEHLTRVRTLPEGTGNRKFYFQEEIRFLKPVIKVLMKGDCPLPQEARMELLEIYDSFINQYDTHFEGGHHRGWQI